MDEKGHLTQYQVASKKRIKVMYIMIIVVIILLSFLCYKLLGQDMYMLVSLIILVATMAPFFMIFEKRKPKAREIMLIAMMSAITVFLHTIFHVIMPIQIGTAMVIISGISLGPEAGFLIGALSRLICNFYMGQGPWTPWQMFCWGLLGFLAGLIFNKDNVEEIKSRSFKIIAGPIMSIIFTLLVGYISYIIFPNGYDSFIGWRLYFFGIIGLIIGLVVQKKQFPVDGLTMAVMTFFMTFIIYGGIMNISTVINSTNMPGAGDISLNGLKLIYISGAPYDFFHGLTAAICVFLFGDNIIKKLERIKIKFGIYR